MSVHPMITSVYPVVTETHQYVGVGTPHLGPNHGTTSQQASPDLYYESERSS